MEQNEFLRSYYEAHDEDARLRSQRGSVEFLTTVRYIEKYLQPGMKICEIGAGTGRYSHHFAGHGYAVDAVELVPHNIDIFRQNTRPGEQVRIFEGTATDLTFLADNSYDITLLLGPMYHLYTETDQLSALHEALRVTRQGGIVFAAYCLNDATMVQYCFMKKAILDRKTQELIDFDTFKLFSPPEKIFVMHRREEIDALMTNFNVERLHYVGTDMITRYITQTIEEMNDELFALYLRYHFSICERADMVGYSNHALDVFRKR